MNDFNLKYIHYTYTSWKRHTKDWYFYVCFYDLTNISKLDIPRWQLSTNWPVHPPELHISVSGLDQVYIAAKTQGPP
jgi:hypothetical protein